MDATTVSYFRLALTLASAIVYAYVGARLSRRQVEGEAKLAAQLFAAWWVLLGAVTAITAAQGIAALAGVTDLAFYLTAVELEFLVLTIALWALLYYLVYVLTGSRVAMLPLTIFYSAFFVWILYLVALVRFDRVDLDGAAATLHPTVQVSPAVTGVLLVALLGPVLVAAVGYARLFFRVEGRTQRYRIGLVAVTLLAWFGSSAIASATGASKIVWWPIVSGLLGLAAAVSIFFAYQPPSFIRRRFGISAVGEDQAQG